MMIAHWKAGLVAYLIVALGTLVWQLYANEFLALCQFSHGSCGNAMVHYGALALVWPLKLI